MLLCVSYAFALPIIGIFLLGQMRGNAPKLPLPLCVLASFAALGLLTFLMMEAARFLAQPAYTLASEIKTMESALRQANPLVEAALYTRLLQGVPITGEARQAMERLLPGDEGQAYAVILLRFQASPFPVDASGRMALYLSHHLRCATFVKLIELTNDTKALIVSPPEMEALAEQLAEAVHRIESELSLPLFAAIGDPVSSLSQLSASCGAAGMYLELSERFGLHKVITRENAGAFCDASVYFPLEQERALVAALTQGRTDISLGILRGVIEKNKAERGNNLPELSLALALCVNRALDAMGKSPADMPDEWGSLYLFFRRADGYDELLEAASAALERLSALLREQTNPDLSETMVRFIDENIHRDISLNDLADHLGLTRNYASTLFRNMVGENFKECVSRKRYSRACELLRADRHIKVKDVAAHVGCSTDILERLFIRYSGMPPQTYRQQNRPT